MQISKFNERAQHEISLILLKSILLTSQQNDIAPKLKQIEEFSKSLQILNPIYATGNLYKGIYALIDQKVYSSVVISNPIAVFDYLGIKWSPDKTMILEACGDYLTFYENHYKWQDIFKQIEYLYNLLERKRKRQEEKLSKESSLNSTYLQGIILEEGQSFYHDTAFVNFCNQLVNQNSALLLEPDFIKIVLGILQVNSNSPQPELKGTSPIQKRSSKTLEKLLRYSNHK